MVIELGHSVAAPFAGQILAVLGAEVIKVEKAEGDDARFSSNPKRVEHQAAPYDLIEAEMAKRGNAERIALLEQAGSPCAPVQIHPLDSVKSPFLLQGRHHDHQAFHLQPARRHDGGPRGHGPDFPQ